MKRYHLATLLLLTLLAGAFVGANMRQVKEAPGIPLLGYRRTGGPILGPLAVPTVQGWPFTFRTTYHFIEDADPREIERWRIATNWQGAVWNIAIGLAGLALAGYVAERIIRRGRSH